MTDGPSYSLPGEPLDPFERETPAWERSQGRMAMAHELAEVGMDLARALRAEVMARVSGGPDAAEGEVAARAPVFGGDVGLTYSRIARAVRMSLALEAMIDGDVQVRAERVRSDRRFRDTVAEMKAAEARADEAKDVVRSAVRGAIEAERGERGEREQLYRELEEVLEDEHDQDMMGGLTMAEAIAYVCRELGVPFDAELWLDEADEDEDLGAEAAEAPDRADRPDGLDRVLDQANRGEAAWPAGPGKPRPP